MLERERRKFFNKPTHETMKYLQCELRGVAPYEHVGVETRGDGDAPPLFFPWRRWREEVTTATTELPSNGVKPPPLFFRVLLDFSVRVRVGFAPRDTRPPSHYRRPQNVGVGSLSHLVVQQRTTTALNLTYSPRGASATEVSNCSRACFVLLLQKRLALSNTTH